MHQQTGNSDQLTVGRRCHAGALNWTAAVTLQDYSISLVGYKFAGFFFPKKIRILAWTTVFHVV
jgi:hypothetical protein